jgi:F-type H+-transporting ATPase subunit gamma
MAKGMRDIKRQIRSKQNMMQITRAMEMVAAAKLKRAQDMAVRGRPYANKIKEVIGSIASSSGVIGHPMLTVRPVNKTAYLIFTSDRGLAGGFNANVCRRLEAHIRETHASDNHYGLFIIGRKGRDFFRKRKYPVLEEVTGMPDSPRFADVKHLANMAVQGFVNGEYDELILVYNEFINPMTQRPVLKKLLPLTQEEFEPVKAEYEYEPSPEEVLDVLLPRYAETLIYSALLESKASEFGARMTAMGNATKNAKKMIDQLTLSYNRARQAAITQEISEIVAGANALS